MKNSVLKVLPTLVDISVVGSRWIFKVKHGTNINIEKYKARFVANGFSQVKRIDYEEIFSPVARYSSIRSIIALDAHMGWKITRWM